MGHLRHTQYFTGPHNYESARSYPLRNLRSPPLHWSWCHAGRTRPPVKKIEGEQKKALSVFLGKERHSRNQARIRKPQFATCFRATAIACRKAHVASSCLFEGAEGSQDCVIVNACNKSAALGHRLEMTAGKLKGTNKLAA